jgi:predicted enzyme related to lactoylglutathione lyase
MADCNPVRWFEIYVQDMERARRFYEVVLDTQLQRLDTDLEMWVFPMSADRAGIGGSLVKIPGVRSGGNSTLVYFACEDCAVEAGRIESAGGKVEREKISIGQYGYVVLALDTEGNLIGLHSTD